MFQALLSLALQFFVLTQLNAERAAICYDLRAELGAILMHDECRFDSDCVSVKLPRPFSCTERINRDFLPDLAATYEDYNRLCGPFLFQCFISDRRLRCEGGRCTGAPDLSARFPNNSTTDSHGRPLR